MLLLQPHPATRLHIEGDTQARNKFLLPRHKSEKPAQCPMFNVQWARPTPSGTDNESKEKEVGQTEANQAANCLSIRRFAFTDFL